MNLKTSCETKSTTSTVSQGTGMPMWSVVSSKSPAMLHQYLSVRLIHFNAAWHIMCAHTMSALHARMHAHPASTYTLHVHTSCTHACRARTHARTHALHT